MPTFVEDYGDRRGYGDRVRWHVRDFDEQVQIFNKAAFGRINRLAVEDMDGAADPWRGQMRRTVRWLARNDP